MIRSSYEVDQVLEGWFGQKLEDMEDEKHIEKYLFDPLREIEEKLNQRISDLEAERNYPLIMVAPNINNTLEKRLDESGL